MSKKSKPYPKNLYINREAGGTEDEYLNPLLRAEAHADLGAVKRIAWYQLREVLIVRGKAEVQGTGGQ